MQVLLKAAERAQVPLSSAGALASVVKTIQGLASARDYLEKCALCSEEDRGPDGVMVAHAAAVTQMAAELNITQRYLMSKALDDHRRQDEDDFSLLSSPAQGSGRRGGGGGAGGGGRAGGDTDRSTLPQGPEALIVTNSLMVGIRDGDRRSGGGDRRSGGGGRDLTFHRYHTAGGGGGGGRGDKKLLERSRSSANTPRPTSHKQVHMLRVVCGRMLTCAHVC
jgi:hypothetical protein